MLDSTDVSVHHHVILRNYSILQSTVYNIIRRRNDRNNEHEETRGQKRKLTATCIRAWLKCTRENRFKSSRVINAKFSEFRPGQHINSAESSYKKQIKNYVALCKPYLTRKHQKRKTQ